MISDGSGSARTRTRMIAVVIAVALVGGAYAVRTLVIDDDDTNVGGRSSNELRVACVDELADACAELDAAVTVEAAGATAERLVAASSDTDAGVDVWLTAAPWAEIVDQRRSGAGADPILDVPDEPVARSPLVLVGRTDRAEVITAACGGAVTWTCVGDRAGTPWSGFGGRETWGDVRPAHAEPETSVHGLLALGQAVGDFVASDTVPVDAVSRLDWETNDAFPGWFQQLERAIPADAFEPGRDPFDRWLQTRGVAYDLVATTEAAAVIGLDDAADVREASTVLYPAPVASADLVLVPVAGGRVPDDLADDVRSALADAGYRTDGSSPPDGAPALADTDNLPPAGSLDALRGLWATVR